jgi:GntR family transcriptional regulator, transcriptional repressor for pyruvate dehydrogenase complex
MDPVMDPVVTSSVPDQIQRRILGLLSERKLVPGQRLASERELAHALQVSRTTLRDALGGLAARGVLHARRGSGWYVQLDARTIANALAMHFQLTDVTVDQLLEARQAIEPVVAYYAAERRTAEDLNELEALVEEMETLADGDGQQFLLMADKFHGLVAALTRNPFFGVALEPLFGLMREQRKLEPGWSGRAAQEEHRRLLVAIKAQDADGAANAMAQHLGGAKMRSWIAR